MSSELIIQRLLEANSLREPVLRAAIQALQLPKGSRGLDLGSGIGLQSMLLADAVGPGGQVTAADIDAHLLAYGERLAGQAGYAGQIVFRQADMHRLPFDGSSFDWVWSADCVGYPLADLPPLLDELQRVVQPGGSIALLAWTSQQVLPGYPLLEARLNGACSSYAPYLEGKDPEHHFLRALRWFREAGLEAVEACTFTCDVSAPLNSSRRAALASLFDMLWAPPPAGAPQDDWSESRRLCSPDSPEFIADLPGYYAFFTYTMFTGRRPVI
jgi:ubiquinone/menaquinone biosynthesis C-methylase UbiE